MDSLNNWDNSIDSDWDSELETKINEIVAKVNEQKHLGLILDSKLSFEKHLNEKIINAKKNIGISAFVETDRCNPSWIDAMNKMDVVIVPSQHIKKIIQKLKNQLDQTILNCFHTLINILKMEIFL